MSQTHKKISIVSFFIILIAVYFISGAHSYFSLEQFQSIRSDLITSLDNNPILFVTGFILVYIIMVATSLPAATFLTISGGAIMGWQLASIAVVPAATIGSIVPYLVARYVTKGSSESKYRDSFKKLKQGVAESGWWYLLAARLSAIIPFYILNIVSGIARIPFRDYVSATFFGIIPATAVFTYAGSQIGESTETGTILRPGILVALILLAALPLTIRYIQLKIRKKRESNA